MKKKISWAGLHSAVSRAPDCRSRGRKFESQLDHIIFVEIDHEIISIAILSLLLIQDSICQLLAYVLVNHLDD